VSKEHKRYRDEDDRRNDYDRHYEPEDGPSSNDKTMGMLAHLLSLFTGFIGPLVMWLSHREKSEFVARHGKEAFNNQISQIFCMIIAIVVGAIVGFGTYLVYPTPFVGIIVGYVMTLLLMLTVSIFSIISMIRACMAASRGDEFRYPLTIRLF
jgi:uncharacterized protein